MHPPSMEMVFLILSGAILLAGVLYWFWSHLQLTQKKVQLLENAVFELRSMLSQRPEPPAVAESGAAYTDLSDEDWTAEDERSGATIEHVSTPLAELHTGGENRTVSVVREDADDLLPGGRIVPITKADADEERTVDLHTLVREEEQFRELFITGKPDTPERKTTMNESDGNHAEAALDSMPVKELRRLAEQRGIQGAADMRKKEILAALRSQVGSGSSGSSTMDLAEITESAIPTLE